MRSVTTQILGSETNSNLPCNNTAKSQETLQTHANGFYKNCTTMSQPINKETVSLSSVGMGLVKTQDKTL